MHDTKTASRRRWGWGATAGVAALLAVQAQAGLPASADSASLDRAYAEHLLATKGIAEIRTYHASGAGLNGMDVVVVSAGFKAEEKEEFRRVCEDFVTALFQWEPWSRYRNIVNVHGVFVEDKSLDETRLQAGGYKGNVLFSDNGMAFEYAMYAADAAVVAVIHNSAFATPACGTWGVMTGNKASVRGPGAIVHEFGHCLAGLGDEYIQRADTYDGGEDGLRDFTVNVTSIANPRLCRWHYWTEEQWPGLFSPQFLPPGVHVINAEGAGWPKGIYRPEEACIMRGSRDRFCALCMETMEASFFRYVDPFNRVEPAQGEIVLWKGEALDFLVQTIPMIRQPPEWLTSRLEFYVDGKQVRASDRGEVRYALSGKAAAPGVHQLGANLNLQIDRVRRDFGYLSASRGWCVRIMPLARPRIAVAPRVAIAADGAVEVPVRVKPAGFNLRMVHAPSNAVLADGRFTWKPNGACGSWRVDFVASLDGVDGAAESLLLDVRPARAAPGTVAAEAPEVVDAATGERTAVRVKASASDGSHILFEPVDLPAGCVLDRSTGELAWTPQTAQAGPQPARVRARSGAASCERTVVFRVRRPPKPTPASFVNTTVPDTLAALKQLQEGPVQYRRLFETLRLLRSRNSALHRPALEAAVKMYEGLAPELKATALQDLTLHAWAFTDKAEILAWMRQIAAAGSSEDHRALQARLDTMGEVKALREVETGGGADQLPALAERLPKAGDAMVRSSVVQAVAAICRRAENKEACEQPILAAVARARGPDRTSLLLLLPLVGTPGADHVLIEAALDADEAVASRAAALVESTAGTNQLPRVLAALASAQDAGRRAALEKAAAAIARRFRDKGAVQGAVLAAQSGAKGPARAALIRLVPRVQTPAAVAAWTAAAGDPDPEVAAAASQSLEYLKGLGSTDGYVTRWLLSGPHVSTNGGSLFEFAFPPEKKGGKAEWRPIEAALEKGYYPVPLDKIIGGESRVAYLKATIRSREAREILFEAGSDDGIKVWLNGELVHANNADRPVRPAQDLFKARLKAGENVMLCKIIQGIGQWGACMRLRAADGGDALGVTVEGAQGDLAAAAGPR